MGVERGRSERLLGRGRPWRRAIVCLAVVGLAVGAIAASPAGFGQSNEPRQPEPADSRVVPPAPYKPTGTEQVTPLGQPPPFPVSQENQPGVRRRSGGPYVSQDKVVATVLDHLRCGKAESKNVCRSIVVEFHARYEDAWRRQGASWGFVSAFACDREVYFVTVRGEIDLTTTARTLNDNAVKRADHWNYEIDGTTGEILGSGTAGTPLAGEEILVMGIDS